MIPAKIVFYAWVYVQFYLFNIEVGEPYTFSLLCYYFLADTQALD